MTTIAAIQFQSLHDYEKNVKKATDLVKEAKKMGADVVLLQELFQRDYFCQVEDYDFFAYAEERRTSPTLAHFRKLAKELSVVLPVSFFERAGNCYYNSLVCFDKDGEDLGLYRKSHIPTGQCYEEKFYFRPGDTGFKVFKTKECGNLGVAICWDQWYLETGRLLALKGADCLFFPTAIGSEPVLKRDTSRHWTNAICGQAALNIVPAIASNRFGSETINGSTMTFFGSSLIADEEGNILSQAKKDEEKILIASFDFEAIREKRRTWGIYRDRRTDLYDGILKGDLTEEGK